MVIKVGGEESSVVVTLKFVRGSRSVMASLTEGDQLEQKPPGRDPGVGRSDLGNCFGETKCILEAAGSRAGAVN